LRIRGNDANAYYHGYVKVPLAMHFGVSPGYMHEFLLIKFALIDITPEEYIVESTTGMTKDRFAMFVEQCWQWGISQGVPLESYKHIGDNIKFKIIKKQDNGTETR
jgi:hypothetical protein